MRLIDADELLKHIPSEELCSRMAVVNAPTVAVLCKDCVFYEGRPCGIVDYYNEENDYCSAGRRRTE